MVANISDNFISEVFDNDNRSYQYRIVITLASGESITITNDDIVEQGGIVIDEAISNSDSLDIGVCPINKLSITLRNFDGEFDEYDFRGAGVVLHFGLPVEGTLEEYQRGMYVIRDIPTYDTNTVTLTCYDYFTLFDDVLISDISAVYGNNVAALIAIVAVVQRVNNVFGGNIVFINPSDLPIPNVILSVPEDQTMTCRELLGYIAQTNGGNFRFNALGQLEFTWYGSGYTDLTATIRQLQSGAVRIVEDNVVRVSYLQQAGEVIWKNRVNIPSLYTLTADKNDTVVTGVRIIINTGTAEDGEDIIDATTYVTGTSDYQISIENNPLITTSNADTVLATLAAVLVGFKYRQASFTHPGMPWIMAGDSARIRDAKGEAHNVLISSTTFTSLDRQTTESSGIPNVFNTPSRFSAETKAYVRAMEDIKPVVNTINQRLANANGLYETQVTDQSTQAVITYLHEKSDLADSNIVIMFSTEGIWVTSNYQTSPPTWYGLGVDGTMIANILETYGIDADWINAGAFTILDANDNVLFKADATNKEFYWNAPNSSMDSDGNIIIYDEGQVGNAVSFQVVRRGQSLQRYAKVFSSMFRIGVESTEDTSDTRIYPGRFYITRTTESDLAAYDYETHSLELFANGKLEVYHVFGTDAVGDVITRKVFELDIRNETAKLNEEPIATISTPTFTAASGITVSQQTWSKVGNIVTGDLTLSKNAAISTTTVNLGTLSEHPGHTVIANARTASVQMRASIDSSGIIHINSPSSVAANTTIYLSLSFVAA